MPTLITAQGTKLLLKAHFGGEIGLIWGELRASVRIGVGVVDVHPGSAKGTRSPP